MQTKTEPASLAELEPGEVCKIVSVELDGLLRRRIMDMGLIPGTLVRCVRKSPTGDPIAFKVRNTVVALRGADAGLIKLC